MTEGEECGSGLRADAERNRRRILDAACALFSTAGLDVPLEDVARLAGVGIATLYRRFPTRADLAGAVFAEQIWRYRDVVDRAAAEQDDWEAISSLVRGLSVLQGANAGLREMITMSFATAPAVQETFTGIQDRMERLVDRIVASGVVRPDFDRADLMLFMLSNSGVVSRLEGEAADQARARLAALFLEGIRNRPEATPLPSGPGIVDLRRAIDPRVAC